MKRAFLGGVVWGLLMTVAFTQEPASPAGPTPGQYGQHGGMRMGGMMGRGMMGTVIEVAADHFTIRNEAGETRTVNYSANTRFVKQPPMRQTQSGERVPMQPIAASDIKVGDAIAANGEVDASGNSVGAMLVVQLDPQRAQQMREMQANFGKTWLMGKVTAIDETRLTLQSPIDNTQHTFVVDENTMFRKRRDPVTLADVQVGDNVHVEGAVKGGVFTATAVHLMGMPPARGGPMMPPPGSAPPQ